MVTLLCGRTTPHQAHKHVIIWRQADLPEHERRDDAPATWTGEYQCPGEPVKIKPDRAAWDTVQAHSSCIRCENCVDRAVELATMLGQVRHTYRELPHAASVYRKGARR